MNCKHAEELIPLYAGRDLDDQQARLLAEHLLACPACAGTVEEYRESLELTREFPAPVFTGDVYASVRRQVLRRIESEPEARSWRQLFAGWLQPRPAWAVAALLIVGFAFIALYLLNRNAAPVQPVAEKRPAVNSNQKTSAPTATPQITTVVNTGIKSKPVAGKRKIISGVVNQTPLVATKVGSPVPDTPATLVKPDAPNSLPAGDAGESDSPLRVEIQTRDPNIRIIWFAQRENKRAVSNSKGT
jgi:hypothetical protein